MYSSVLLHSVKNKVKLVQLKKRVTKQRGEFFIINVLQVEETLIFIGNGSVPQKYYYTFALGSCH